MLLHIRNNLPRISLVPASIEFFRRPKLDNEIARQVLRLGLAALLTPKSQQSSLVPAHDDACVGAAYKERR